MSIQSIHSILHEKSISKNTEEIANENTDIPELTPKEHLEKTKSSIHHILSVLWYLHPQFHKSVQNDEADFVDWKDDMQFFEDIRILALFFPDLLKPILHSVLLKLCELSTSLQSAVMKNALRTISDVVVWMSVFFTFLRFYFSYILFYNIYAIFDFFNLQIL